MFWRKHPGIWFTLYGIVTIAMLSLLFALIDLPAVIEGNRIWSPSVGEP